MQLRISFKDIFPDETPKAKFEEYLVDVERLVLLRAGTLLTSKANENWQTTLKSWFSVSTLTDSSIAGSILLNFSILQKRNQDKFVGFVNKMSSLRFFEYCWTIQDDNSTSTSTLSAFQQELQIFKGYLWLNEQQNENEKKVSESIKSNYPNDNESLNLLRLMLGKSFSSYYFDNYIFQNVLYAQVIKVCELFQFLESREDLKLYLTKFLENTKSKTWEDYLRKFLPLIRHKNESKNALLVIEEASIREFIENLVLQVDDADTDKDFRIIRAKPIFKDLKEENTYHIVFELFLLEKMYGTMYFALDSIHRQLFRAGQGAKLPNQDKNIPEKEFKNFYGSEFVEKWLLYKMLENIFSNLDCKFKRGSDLTFKNQGEPDFYAQQGENVYLFECKDTLGNAEIKHSYDFLKIEEEIKTKLYWKQEKTKKAPKAILQLLTNAERILSRSEEFEFDKCEDKKIYPIVVVDSQGINSLGVNSLLRYWFDEELTALKKENPTLKWQNVRPIVLVDMDTFILYQTALANGQLSLHQILDNYIYETTIDIERANRCKKMGKIVFDNYVNSIYAPFSFFMQQRYSRFITSDKWKEYIRLFFTDDDNV